MPTPTSQDVLLGVEDVARLMGMSKRWVYETFSNPNRGGIRPIKLGHVSKWYRYDVLNWIAKQHEASR